ncbi:MAG TPA: PHB depolymerase family esterase [Polyangiales bacterium]|nr:PHB depolymerase family esterase [Polyangiales bacterium]
MRARALLAVWCGASFFWAGCSSSDPERVVRPVKMLDASTDEPDQSDPLEAGMTATGRTRDVDLLDGAVNEPEGQKPPAANGGGPASNGGGQPPPTELPPPPDQPSPAGAEAPPPFVDPRIPWPMFEDDAGVDEDDGGAPQEPPRPTCTGKPGSPGNTTRMYDNREYIVHIPPMVDPNTAMPVMFVYHGAGGKGADMQQATGFDIVADWDHVITVYPTGQAGNAPWNVGRNVCPPGNFVSTTADDVAYLDAMLNDIEIDQCLDRGRVFVTGFSMGGYMSNQLGCQLGRARLRAVAPHSGGTYSGDCEGGALPVLLLHGDADSLINYNCGTQARDYWIDRNGCSPQYDTWDITGGQCRFYRGCPSGAPVVMCTFYGMDHTWAYPPMWESSSLLIWSFFSTMF